MSIHLIEGSLFNSQCQTIVNSVNCVGVMGKGIALEFRLRYPDMYQRYVELCNEGLFEVGKLWIYKADDKWILNFPTKKHWKYPTKLKYLELGLQKFFDTYKDKNISSIAFPLLGTQNGKLDSRLVLELMKKYLAQCDLPIEIYTYKVDSLDYQFEKLRKKLEELSLEKLVDCTGLSINHAKRIKDALQEPTVKNATDFLKVKGIGITSVEKIFKAFY